MKRVLYLAFAVHLAASLAIVDKSVGQDSAEQDASNQQSGSDEQDQKRSDIGEHQRLAERKMAELEVKFLIIAQKLEEKEPERAKRLVEALQQAKEKLIAKKMNEITELLDQQKLEQAERELDAVILNLEELVRLLLNEKKDTMSRRQEMEMLRKWRDEIMKLKKEQNNQTRETSKIANKDKTLKTLDQQIKAVEQLIKEQEEVISETEKRAGSGLQALDRVADQQYGVRKQTEDLAKEISGEPDPSDLAQPVNTDARPGDSKPGDSKPGDSKPGDSKPGDSKPGDSKPGDSKPGDSKPGDSKPGDSQPKDSEPGGDQPKQPGQQPLEAAAQQQQSAEKRLTSGKATDAKRAEDQALAELNRALEELKKEQRRIASLPPEAFEQMAKKQERTGEKTSDLAKEMAKAPKPSNSQENQDGQSSDGQGKSGQQQPGQQSVQRAQKAMENAAGDLGEQEAQKAQRQQEQAEEELDKALREIEERLNQLREETREEKLARLEARFREMLARQQIASIMTLELDDKKTHLNRLRRRDLLTLLRLSTEELEISELGQQAYDLLLEDGTSVVFPEIVQDVREDLIRVGQLLETEQTGPLTQLIQGDIESTLEELLEALKQAKRDGKSGGGGGGGGNSPLLRKSAELKMLRQAQLRVNRLTAQVDLLLQEDKLETNQVSEPIAQEVKKIADRQGEIVEIMLRLLEEKE